MLKGGKCPCPLPLLIVLGQSLSRVIAIKFCGYSPTEEFEFVTEDFNMCTEFCNGGVQSRTVNCVRTVDGMSEVVDDEDCINFGLAKPAEEQRCNERPCPSFVAGDFGMVSH